MAGFPVGKGYWNDGKRSTGFKSESRSDEYFVTNRQGHPVKKKVEGVYACRITRYELAFTKVTISFESLDLDLAFKHIFRVQSPNYAKKQRGERQLAELRKATGVGEYWEMVNREVALGVKNSRVDSFARYIPGTGLKGRRDYRRSLPSLLACRNRLFGTYINAVSGNTDLEEYGAPIIREVYFPKLARHISVCLF